MPAERRLARERVARVHSRGFFRVFSRNRVWNRRSVQTRGKIRAQRDAPRFGEPVAPGGDGEQRRVGVAERRDEPDVPTDVGVPAQCRERRFGGDAPHLHVTVRRGGSHEDFFFLFSFFPVALFPVEQSLGRRESHRRDAPAVAPRAPRRIRVVAPDPHAAVRVPRGDERRRSVQRADPRVPGGTRERAERFPDGGRPGSRPGSVFPVFRFRRNPSQAPRERRPVPPARDHDAPVRFRVHQLDALDRPRVPVQVVPRVLARAPPRLERERLGERMRLKKSSGIVRAAAPREQTRPEPFPGRHFAPRAARRARRRQRARRQKRERQLERVRGQIRDASWSWGRWGHGECRGVRLRGHTRRRGHARRRLGEKDGGRLEASRRRRRSVFFRKCRRRVVRLRRTF